MPELQTELVQLAAGTVEPITLPAAKLYLKVDDDFDDFNVLIAISAARQYAESFCRKSFQLGDRYQLTLNRFPYELLSGEPYVEGMAYQEVFSGSAAEYMLNRPAAFAIELPMGPVTSVTAITYTDAAGAPQTLAPTTYELVQDGAVSPRLYPTFGNFWPATQYGPEAAQITYNTGAKPNPLTLKGMLILMADFYANRDGNPPPGYKQGAAQDAAERLLWFDRDLEV